MVIEILSISCYVLYLVTADDGHLGMPNSKQSNLLHARIIVIQNWYDSIEIFFVSHFAIFSNGSRLHWSILNYEKKTHCRKHFDINLIKIRYINVPCQNSVKYTQWLWRSFLF